MNKFGLLFIGLLFYVTACDKRLNYINKTFQGFWAETLWTYEFKPNGQFKFKADGHYDLSEYFGTYTILDNLIFLNPNSDWQTLDGVLKPRLKIINPDCIKDFESNYYCSSIDLVTNWNEKEYKFQTLVTFMLDSLPTTKKEKEIVEQNNVDGDNYVDIKFVYDGIIIDKKRELHLFKLEKRDLRTTTNYADYLVNKDPFEIFRHTNKRDSLVSIYKK